MRKIEAKQSLELLDFGMENNGTIERRLVKSKFDFIFIMTLACRAGGFANVLGSNRYMED